jgi:hypothetical protein
MPRFGLLLMQRAGQAIYSGLTGQIAVRRMTMSWCTVKTMTMKKIVTKAKSNLPTAWLSFVGRTRFGLNPVTETMERYKRCANDL